MSKSKDGNNDSNQENHNTNPYRPNYIDLDKRAVYLGLSCLLIAYAIASLVNDDFFIWLPGGRRSRFSDAYIHLHGIPVWFACAAIVSACVSMLSVIVDHHDTRNNEMMYQKFSSISLKLAFVLIFFAVIVDGLYFKKGTYERKGFRPFASSSLTKHSSSFRPLGASTGLPNPGGFSSHLVQRYAW